MVNNNEIPIEVKKPFETVYELKNEIPSFEEFMKDYKVDENLNYDDLRGGNIGEVKGYGPCTDGRNWRDCNCSRNELQRQYTTAVIENNTSVKIDITNIWIEILPGLPRFFPITEVKFETRGTTKPGNYRGVGTIFGLVGNIVGGLIKDEDRHKTSGVLFTSYKRRPLTFWSFYETSTFSTMGSSSKGDFHDDKIICKSRGNLTELKGKIGDIVEIWEWNGMIKNRADKENYFRNKVGSLLDTHENGGDINGHYWI